MNKKIIFGILSVLVLVGAVGVSKYLISSKEAPKTDTAKHNTMFVKTELGKVKTIAADMSYRGRMTSFDNVSLSAEVSGKLLQGDVRFKAGENFKKGDLIVRIYSEDVEASLMSGKSAFLQTLSVILPDLKVDYSDQYEKWESFFNAIDVDKPLPAMPEMASDKEKIFLASNNVLGSYYSLIQQEINLTRYTIYAPFDGSFKTVSKEIGGVSSPSAELATIIRTDKLEVVVPVFLQDLQWVKKGEMLNISKDNGETIEVEVSRIASFVDAATQSVNVYLTYSPKGDNHILEGEYVDVRFNTGETTGFEIPREALFNTNHVYCLEEGKLKGLEINILRQLDDSYIITGVDSTTLVVTESLSSVNPNVEYLAR